MNKMTWANYPKLRDVFKFGQHRLEWQERSRNLTTPIILIAITLAISIISITSYTVLRELILQQLREKALLKVSQGTEEIDQWLLTRASEVKTIANTPVVRSLNWSNMEPYLKTEVERINEFFLFGLTTRDASFYTTSTGKSQHTNIDREHIQKAFAAEDNISDPFIGRASRVFTIAVVSPVYGSNYDALGTPQAVFFGSLKLDRVTKVVNQLRYGESSYAFALNSQGEAIIHPNRALISTPERPVPSLLQSTDPNLAAIARLMLNNKPGIELMSIDGTLKYLAYVPLKQANWSVALVIPRDQIESQLGPLNLLASILGGLIFLATIIGWRQIQLSAQAKDQVRLLSEQKKILHDQAQELEQTLRELQQTQAQLIHTEKMSSLGQLVAGVAHEINNPISFIYSNITPAKEYCEDLFRLLQLYQEHYPQPKDEIQAELEVIDLDFLMTDLPQLLVSMQSGANRIKEIVLSLRNFSRLDEAEMKEVNIHEGIDSTLMILENRFKPTSNRPAIEVYKEYDHIPPIYCYPGQLNQVFINIINNAIDAIEEIFTKNNLPFPEYQGRIHIETTLTSNKQVIIRITDNGIGIPENIQNQLFDPFFTTKPVGKGTGLGLSVSYQIVTEKHQGKLQCISTPGKGAEFMIYIPCQGDSWIKEQG